MMKLFLIKKEHSKQAILKHEWLQKLGINYAAFDNDLFSKNICLCNLGSLCSKGV